MLTLLTLNSIEYMYRQFSMSNRQSHKTVAQKSIIPSVIFSRKTEDEQRHIRFQKIAPNNINKILY